MNAPGTQVLSTKETPETTGTDLARGARARQMASQFGILWIFILLATVLSLKSDAFLTSSNFENILNNQAPALIIGAAGTLVIIAGGFDLSVGAIFALSSVVASKLVPSVGPVTAMTAAILVGVLMGVGNGLVITYGRVNSFMATLGSSLVIGGVAFVITNGSVVVVESTAYGKLGQGEFLGIPIAIYVALVFVVAIGVLLASTVVGRHIYATGDNAEAANLSGINVARVKIVTYALSGLAAGLAGVLYSSRFQSGQADAGSALTFAVIAAIVVGGTSIQGGDGAVWRTCIGVLFIAMVGNGFNLLQIDATYQQIVQGAIILGAVGLDGWSRQRRD